MKLQSGSLRVTPQKMKPKSEIRSPPNLRKLVETNSKSENFNDQNKSDL